MFIRFERAPARQHIRWLAFLIVSLHTKNDDDRVAPAFVGEYGKLDRHGGSVPECRGQCHLRFTQEQALNRQPGVDQKSSPEL